MSVRSLLFTLLLMAPLAQAAALPDFATDDERNTIEIFEYASPSVVFVTNQQLVRDPRSFSLQTVPRGAGTGFVWSEDGHIVTNFHVIEGAREIIITLPDQSTWSARVVGLAPERDLAVLHIDAPKEKLQIGRASCRERVQGWDRGGSDTEDHP